MSYTVEPINVTSSTKVVEPYKNRRDDASPYKWWLAQNDKDLCTQVLSTTEYLKQTNRTRIRQASIFSRLACGKPLYNYLAANSTLDASNSLPIGRPTANVVYSCSDTLTSRITLDQPKPVFLTEAGNYKDRQIAKESNQFIQGEFYRLRAYEQGEKMVREACYFGDGFLKVYPKENKVASDVINETELLVDFNDGYYGFPRQMIQLKLVDRGVLQGLYPEEEETIAQSMTGSIDTSPRSQQTVSDQIIIAEAWHLLSSTDSHDGRHVIVSSDGIILDEKWEKPNFPFVKLGYNPLPVGYFAQSLSEILMPTQMEIYRLLILASQSIELMGVPRILMEEMSSILETAFNNRIGTIIKYRQTPPQFVNATSNSPEIYQWIEFLIQNSYQMSGISSLSATGLKPSGLNSGESLREYDSIQDARFATFDRRYKRMYEDYAKLVIDTASDIAKETGKYETVFPGKDGLKRVDFKSIARLKDNFIIQLYDESSLPKDPAGRQARLSEMLAAGEISLQEFRRLSNFPDLEQSDQLAIALEERILKALDEIIENGDKNYASIAPDSFILDPTDLATQLSVQYINLYSRLELEDQKLFTLKNWFNQVQDLKQLATPPPMQQAMPGQGASQGGGPQGPLPVAPPNPSIAPTSNAQV